MRSNWPPAVYLIGAQKAGTTSIAAWLAAHSNVCVSMPKETDFFTGRWERGWDWYATCFSRPDSSVLLDASPSYSMAPLPEALSVGERGHSLMNDVPARIYAARPDARFIYVLRDPFDRAYSAYWHARRAGYERKPIKEALTLNSSYIRGSSYAHQIQHYLDYFSIDRFLFIDFRDLRFDPDGVLTSCWSFLGVEPITRPIVSTKNESFQFNQAGRLVTSIIGGNRRGSFVKKHVTRRLPSSLRGVLRRLLTASVPPMTDEVRLLLGRFLADEYTRTLELTGIDFRSAGPPRGRP
jgi:hypothetical protein